MEKEKDYDKNVDYKAMYFKLMREVAKAVDILIKAQQECEDMYIEAGEEE